MQSEPKTAAWKAVVAFYQSARRQIEPIQRALLNGAKRKQRALFRRSPIGRRLVSHGLFDAWWNADPGLLKRLPKRRSKRRSRSGRIHVDEIAALLTAAEYGLSASTVLREAHTRRGVTDDAANNTA
jgi:hypothetical protein